MISKIIIFFISLMVMVSFMAIPMNIFDEGLIAFGTQRLMWGEVPYKDFWLVYGPAQLILTALAFFLTEPSLTILRIVDALIKASLTTLIFAHIRRFSGIKPALALWAVTTYWISTIGFPGYPMFGAWLFAVTTFSFLGEYLARESDMQICYAGISAGLAAGFRPEIGCYLLICSFVALTLFNLRTNHLRVQSFFFLLLSFSLVLMGIYGPIIILAGFEPIEHFLGRYATSIIPEYRHIPPPTLGSLFSLKHIFIGRRFAWGIQDWVGAYFPLLLLGVGALVPLTMSTSANLKRAWPLFAGEILFVAFLWKQGIHRFDPVHMLPSMVMALGVFTMIISELPSRRVYIPLYSAVILVLVFSRDYYFQCTPKDFKERYIMNAQEFSSPSVPRAGFVKIAGDQEQALKFIRENYTDEKYLFVGLNIHDQLVVNDVMFYFLADKHSASRYHVFNPGFINQSGPQTEIVEELQKRKIRLIVLVDLPRSKEPNKSAVSSGVTTLDNFIRDNYRLCTKFGRYSVLHKASETFPQFCQLPALPEGIRQ
jgi:hypothetical protein